MDTGDFKEKIEEIVAPAVGPVMDMVSDLVLDGAAGAMIPGVGNLILSYKQQRTEKNLEVFIKQIVARQDEFNEKLNRLDIDKLNKITKHYFGLVADYVLDVKQQEKIRYIVNGYLNLTDVDPLNDDGVIMYYDTLDQLTLCDIAILKEHYNPVISQQSLKLSLVPGQIRLINEKLVRLGLLASLNDEKIEKNLKAIGEYLENIDKGKRNSRLKLKRFWGTDSYKITSYGIRFIDFFIDKHQNVSAKETDKEKDL